MKKASPKTKMPPIKIVALGGLGEVGMNLMVIECGDDLIIIDCGVLFPDLFWMGLDLVLPDFSYLVKNKDRVRALFVTHGHEDHIGAIPFLMKEIKIPIIYCSRFASRLINEKCIEHGVQKDLLIHHVQATDVVPAGCFEVEFIHVTHSTLETFALSISTPHGLVIHSGDFKFDEKPYDGPPSDKKRFAALGKKKPLLLLSDSTNSERCGHSASESSIRGELNRLIKEAEEAVVVALFASNIHRVHQLMDIAEECGRKVFLSGRSMERYVHIAIEENYLPVNLSLLRPIEELDRYPRNEVLVLSTGSQGESRSSLLRLAKDENRWLKLKPKDVVILSSRNIPGNERAISYVVNQLYRRGAIVHYEDMQNVHVSGHAYQGEQEELIKLTKPKYFIPIHGEFRHMTVHARTAQESEIPKKSFVMENGMVWEHSADGEITTSEVVTTGRRWSLAGYTGTLDDPAIKERKIAARAGVVVVDCLVRNRGAALVRAPAATLKGFLCSDEKMIQIKDEIEKNCESAFENFFESNPEGLTREQTVGAAARKTVRKFLDLKPLVIVNFLTA